MVRTGILQVLNWDLQFKNFTR
uniref:Uncharacterized protein n=1 Tax=Anguilla anguilla TaxID=7936 RepID=A0A0E9RUI2_ANGAN